MPSCWAIAELVRSKSTNSSVEDQLVVTLRSEDGTVSVMQNNTVNQIFAGYYVDEVAELSIKKGHIVTKTFKLLLENTKATQLENAEPLRLLRIERTKLLVATDWVITMHKELGTNIPAAWKTYRQALRDITDSATSLDDVTWPTKPS